MAEGCRKAQLLQRKLKRAAARVLRREQRMLGDTSSEDDVADRSFIRKLLGMGIGRGRRPEFNPSKLHEVLIKGFC